MPRQARLDSPGTLHHVMIRGIEQRNIVEDDQDRYEFVRRMGEQARETETAIYAWALMIMNNHAHILLRSGSAGLPRFMRRFLTGYAVVYNLRHKRFGHLFQNRYKSILCEEDIYFKELVRYIHLNPIRAGLVVDLTDLENYPWCGFGAIMGRMTYDWQDPDYVLGWFGKTRRTARRSYYRYIEEGLNQGRRPDLVGGGLIRSQGGWSNVISMRRQNDQGLSDERILGSGEFVEQVLREADEKIKTQILVRKMEQEALEVLDQLCTKEKIQIEELRSGSRRPQVSALRSRAAIELVEHHGVSLAEAARVLGVTTSAISKILQKTKVNL
jgi:putative transposase